MAIPLILRHRIKNNPNVITRIRQSKITDEVVDFALSQPGYQFQPIYKCKKKFIVENEKFVRAYINSPDFDVRDMEYILPKISTYSKELKEIIANKIISDNIKINDYSLSVNYYLEQPELLIYYINTNGEIPFINENITLDNFSDEQIDKLYEAINTTGKHFSELPSYLKNTQKLFQKFLEEDYIETVKGLEPSYGIDPQTTNYKMVKNQFLSDIDRNIEHLNYIITTCRIQFSDEERTKILEAARKSKIVIEANTPNFLLSDKYVFINSLSHITDLSQIEKFDIEKMEFTEDDEIAIAQKIEEYPLEEIIKQNRYLIGKLIDNANGAIRRVVERRPVFLDNLRKNAIHFEYVPTVKYGEYFPSENTISEIYLKKENRSFLIEALRRDFDMVVEDEWLRNFKIKLSLEEKREIYLIAKEHGYSLTSASPEFMKVNPYLIAEEIARGNVSITDRKFETLYDEESLNELRRITSLQSKDDDKKEKTRKVIEILLENNILMNPMSTGIYSNIEDSKRAVKTPEYVIKSIQMDFESIYSYGGKYAPMWRFSQEDWKKIYEEYLKNLDSVDEEIDQISIISENPYIILERYKKYGSFVENNNPTGKYCTEEIQKEIAQIYWQRINAPVTRNCLEIERKNPFIILRSIENNPNSIDAIEFYDNPLKKDEIEQAITKQLKLGKYELTQNTPECVIELPKVIEYIVSEAEFSKIYLLKNVKKEKLTSHQIQKIKKRIFEYIEAGNKLKEPIPNILTEEEIIELLKKDPNLFPMIIYDSIFYSDDRFKDVSTAILMDAVQQNILKPSTNLFFYEDIYPEVIDKLLEQDPSNALYMDFAYTQHDLKTLSEKVMEELENETLKIGDGIYCEAVLYIKDLKSKKTEPRKINRRLLEYALERKPNLIFKFMGVISLSEDNNLLGNIIIELIKNRKIEITQETPKSFWKKINSSIIIELIRKDKNIIFLPQVANLDFKFSPEEVNEIVEILGEKFVIDENTPEFIKKIPQICINSTKNDPKSGRFIRYQLIGYANPPGLIGEKDKKDGKLDLEKDEDFQEVLNDINKLENISMKNAEFGTVRHKQKIIIEEAVKRGYILNSKTPELYRMNKKLIISSININPSSIRYALECEKFTKEEREKILNILITAENPILLNNLSFSFLKNDLEYIKFSLENAKSDEEIRTILDSVKADRNNFREIINIFKKYILEEKYIISLYTDHIIYEQLIKDKEILLKLLEKDLNYLKKSKLELLSYTIAEQKQIFDIYKANYERYKDDDEITGMMKKNSFYAMEFLRENFEQLDEYELDGLQLSDEFKDEVKNYYLTNNLQVNPNTPKFLRRNNDFIFQYIQNNDWNLAGLDVLEVAPLLKFAELREHPEYLPLTKFYDEYKSGYEVYFEKWGKERTIEYATRIGELVRYLVPGKEYSIEELAKNFETLILNKNDLTVEETMEILSIVDIKIDKSYFEKNPKFRREEKILLRVLKTNPELITIYEGSDEKIFKAAIDSGLILTDDILTLEYISKSSAIFEKAIEEKIDSFEFYKGEDENIVKKAIEKGYFLNKTKEKTIQVFRYNKYYSTSKVLFDFLLDNYDIDISYYYDGNDEEIFKSIIKKDFLKGKKEEEIVEFLKKKPNFARSDEFFSELLDKYSCNIIKHYTSNTIKIFEKAIQNGFKVNTDFFAVRKDLVTNEYLLNEGIKNDKYCAGFKLSSLNPKGKDSEKVLETIKSILGDDFSKIIPDEKTQKEIINLCSISEEPLNGVILLKCMDYELMNQLGFDEWKKIIKYSFNNPDIQGLITLVENKKVSQFLETYKRLEGIIEDDKAVGVNKFLKFVSLYNVNPQLLEDLKAKIESGLKMSEEEKSDLQIIMYGTSQRIKLETQSSDLGNITEKERNKKLERFNATKDGNTIIKSDLTEFLFNMTQDELSIILERDINTQTIIRIMDRAKKDGNKGLFIDANYMYVLIDLLEQFEKANSYSTEIKDLANRVYSADIETLSQIRKTFFNIKELIRSFYEKEAQAELTNISELINNPEFVEKNGEDIIIDLSKSKHVIYAHVLGVDIKSFFETDKGKVTICVSPESDMHEAYYNGESNLVTVGFDTILKGSFIGSSTRNMNSNGNIKGNDYSDDNVRASFLQKSIRDSYENEDHGDSNHAETLLYRAGLIPSCIILRGTEPTEEERKVKREIEEIINQGIEKGSSDYRIIPFVRTQKHKNRVFNYQKTLPHKRMENDTYTRQEERIDELRKKFANIFKFDEKSDALLIRESDEGKYVIRNGNVYMLQDWTERKTATQKVALKIQKLVYPSDSENMIDMITVRVKNARGDISEKIAIRDVNARDMWNYNRGNGALSPKSNTELMREFLVDHLMCNYVPQNSAFLLNAEGNVYGIDKENSFDAISDFINKDDNVYTNMSYLYFDASEGNNLYRKIFESYITSENPNDVIPQETIEEFLQTAKQISTMDDNQYLELYKEMLEQIEEQDKKEKIIRVIMERKKNLTKDAKEFIQRLNNLRQIEKGEMIESADSIAFINDIHGNVEALRAILNECKLQGKKNIYILGDMIGFGPQSNECLDLIRAASKDFSIRCVLGNHEMYSLMGNKSYICHSGFEPEFTSQIRHDMSSENRRFIESLPISRRITVEGKKIELTHFPIKRDYVQDREIYSKHGEEMSRSSTGSGINQDYLIYGHEHRTEQTINDEVGTIETTNVEGTEFINLPSSGCVHGKKTSYVSICFEEKDGKIVLKPTVNAIEYDREKLEQALIDTNNPKPDFFGGIKRNTGGENLGR